MPIKIDITLLFQLVNFVILGLFIYLFYMIFRALKANKKKAMLIKQSDKEKALEKMKIKDL